MRNLDKIGPGRREWTVELRCPAVGPGEGYSEDERTYASRRRRDHDVPKELFTPSLTGELTCPRVTKRNRRRMSGAAWPPRYLLTSLRSFSTGRCRNWMRRRGFGYAIQSPQSGRPTG